MRRRLVISKLAGGKKVEEPMSCPLAREDKKEEGRDEGNEGGEKRDDERWPVLNMPKRTICDDARCFDRESPKPKAVEWISLFFDASRARKTFDSKPEPDSEPEPEPEPEKSRDSGKFNA
jgi:hypothetical protein